MNDEHGWTRIRNLPESPELAKIAEIEKQNNLPTIYYRGHERAQRKQRERENRKKILTADLADIRGSSKSLFTVETRRKSQYLISDHAKSTILCVSKACFSAALPQLDFFQISAMVAIPAILAIF